MPMVHSKAQAQKRVDRIRSFQEELADLESSAVLKLEGSQRQALTAYHGELLDELAARFDIDVSQAEKQLSLGMKIASFLGALALAASVFFLFYQFWGNFTTFLQVAILSVSPLLATLAAIYATRVEQSGYFAKLFSLVAFACLALELVMLGRIFNITPSPNAFLVCSLFAGLLAYACDARLLLVAGIAGMAAFLSAETGTWSGCYWIYFGERPETFFPAAVILFLISFLPHRSFNGFEPVYRVFALLLIFLPVLVLANWGRISYLPFSPETVETGYQITGFLLSAAAIWFGVRRGLSEVVNTGTVFFTVFLYTKFYDWWWDWLPKYLFFLAVGMTAILLLLIFKRLRRSTKGPKAEAGP